ncbi:MAG: carbamoyltransferase [Candidatus Hydrogenedentes bacterium]|nr:carbamoyltransferase [Candidatus Hydrogenedentota bacterium]
MRILGLSTMTESAAALLVNGQIVAAAEMERFTRVKHAGGFPWPAIDYCLEAGGITLGEVDCVAVYWDPYKLGRRLRYIAETLLRDPGLFIEKLQRGATVWSGAGGSDSGWGSLFRTGAKLKERYGTGPKRVQFFDHHECHMATCFLCTEWDEAALLIMDGAGEAACTTTAIGRGRDFQRLDVHYLPHSLGHFYSAVTGYCGFKMLDGEYKLMGLSPYGDSSGAKWIRENCLVTTKPGRYAFNTGAIDYHRALKGNFKGSFAQHFGPARDPAEPEEMADRYRDVAASAQQAFNEVVLDIAEDLRKKSGAARLGIAGGCGLNCVANGQILAGGAFDEVYVPPVPNDAGGALGAAMLCHTRLTGQRPAIVRHGQYGPEYTSSEIESALNQHPDLQREKLAEETLIERTAQLLANSGIAAWFQGRMEFGARALGNRSFLADPRSADIRDVINQKIKKRELFRPFAPSVTEEAASDYFEISQPSPFMTIVVPVRPERRHELAAVTHVDGTARPQTVSKADNPRYWKLLDVFGELTGVPVLLNTSFNIQEPIVCTPEEAIATFLQSDVDALVMGDFWITRG